MGIINFLKRVTNRDDFVTMRPEAQALYIYLVLSANEDGYSDQLQISMFKAQAEVDDARTLQDRDFIVVDTDVTLVVGLARANGED